MKHFIRHNFPGFELGLVVGLFTFISLLVFLPSASQGRRFMTYTICLLENAAHESAARMRTTIEETF